MVVGAGTAGALLAKRLSDDKKTSVLVLHNGKNLTKNPLIKYSKNAPITVLSILLGEPFPFDPAALNLPPPFLQIEENFFAGLPSPAFPLYETGVTIPQVNADDRQILWGVALPEGGASSINAGAWCRGTNELYAQWEAIAGPSWSVERILKIYKRLERYHGVTNNPQARGHFGPIRVRSAPATGVADVFTAAVILGTGQPFVLDYNNPNTPIGVSANVQLTQRGKNGRYRVSSATAFLNERVVKQKGRKLKILFETPALRTVWEGNTAVGVEYLHRGKPKTVFAKKGVIVCGGLFSSPFLMHSGVGPAALLTSLDIPVIFDNPNVGQGLADQPRVLLIFSSNPADTPEKNTNSLFAQISWLPAPGVIPLYASCA